MRRAGVTIAFLLLVAGLLGCGTGGSASGRHRGRGPYAEAKEWCAERPLADFAASMGLRRDSNVVETARAYSEEWGRKQQGAAFAGCKVGLAGVPARFPASSPSARHLWGRNFLVVAVGGEDEEAPARRPLGVRVYFSSEREHSLGWSAGCNSNFGDVRVTATTMKVSEVGSTAVGCMGAVQAQENSVWEFMAADPRWNLDGERLRLAAGGATLELRGFEDPRLCVLSPRGGRIELRDSDMGCEGVLETVALFERGEYRYLKPWSCTHTSIGDGRQRIVCRDGKRSFAIQGYEPERPITVPLER